MLLGGRRRAGSAEAWLVGLGVVLFLEGSPAVAAGSFGPSVSSRVPAGSTVLVLLDAASPGVEERELVLSLDGGRTFPLRLTAAIGPGNGSASWRVPALPTEHAVLALREGGYGIEEEIVITSSEFAIVPEPGVPAEEPRYRDGEWKTREADDGRYALPSPSLGCAGSALLTALGSDLHAVEQPVRGVPPDPDGCVLPVRQPGVARRSGGAPLRLRVSFSLPLRE